MDGNDLPQLLRTNDYAATGLFVFQDMKVAARDEVLFSSAVIALIKILLLNFFDRSVVQLTHWMCVLFRVAFTLVEQNE